MTSFGAFLVVSQCCAETLIGTPDGRNCLGLACSWHNGSMQALTSSAGAGPPVTLGIHDLLEQSISRSRFGTGASNHTAATSPRASATPRLHSVTATPRLQSRNGRLQEHADLQAVSQAASPRAGTASLEEDGNAQVNHTAMPARRQLEYNSSGSTSDRAVNFSSKRPSTPQVLPSLPLQAHAIAHSAYLTSSAHAFRKKRKQSE